MTEHATSLIQALDLDAADFRFRFLIVDDIWIPLGENTLIETFSPVWNAVVDGFGNHNPGEGRNGQQRSLWDTLHPGRPWAADLLPKLKKHRGDETIVTPSEIIAKTTFHLEKVMNTLASRAAITYVQRRIADASLGDEIKITRPDVVAYITSSCPELPNEIVQACAAAALKAGSERADVKNTMPPHVSGRDSFGADEIVVVKS